MSRSRENRRRKARARKRLEMWRVERAIRSAGLLLGEIMKVHDMIVMVTREYERRLQREDSP